MMENFTLDEALVLKGHWWVPSELEIKSKHGEFTFDPGKYITLKLNGAEALSDTHSHTIGRSSKKGYRLIKGATEEGASVLLLENQTLGFNVFYPRLVFLNHQEIIWNHPDEIRFRRLTARFTNLEDWLPYWPFGEDREYGNEDERLKEASIKYVPPKSIIAPLSSLDAEIRFIPRVSTILGRPRRCLNIICGLKLLQTQLNPLSGILNSFSTFKICWPC